MFAALQSVRLSFATQPVVVVTQTIARGNTIERETVALRNVSFDDSLRGAFHSIDDAVGSIAQVDIPKNDVLMGAMARDAPTVPQGHTSIEVRLASSADGLLPGDKVTLSGAMASVADMQPDIADVHESPDDPLDARLRTLSSNALLTAKPSKDTQGNITAIFAMPPEEAAVVLQAQACSAVIATIN